MSHNFGYTPPDIRDVRAQAPQKKMLPDQMVPPGAIQTGDGWCFLKNEDGSVRVFVVNPTIAQMVASTSLTREEWAAVIDKTFGWEYPAAGLAGATALDNIAQAVTTATEIVQNNEAYGLQAKLDAANAEIARLIELTRPETAPVSTVNFGV